MREAPARLLELLLHHAHANEVARDRPSPENSMRKYAALGIVFTHMLRNRLWRVWHAIRDWRERHLALVLLL